MNFICTCGTSNANNPSNTDAICSGYVHLCKERLQLKGFIIFLMQSSISISSVSGVFFCYYILGKIHIK